MRRWGGLGRGKVWCLVMVRDESRAMAQITGFITCRLLEDFTRIERSLVDAARSIV